MRFILFMFTLLFSILTSGQELQSTWYFQSITDSAGNTVKPCEPTDSLVILPNQTFFYSIDTLNLYAEGSYLDSNKQVSFSYKLPADTVRNYFYEVEDSLLTLEENGVFFKFLAKQDKEQVHAAPFQAEQSSNRLIAILRGVLGITFLIAIAYLLSTNRKKINWRLVLNALLIQVVFALAILKVPFIQSIFEWLSSGFVQILAFTLEGSEFLFGGLVADTRSFGYIFAFQVLPTIIFFSALTSLLFYYGLLQKLVYGFAWLMKRTLRLSGAESLAAAGNIFLGQTEAPLLVKPYVDKMTRSELLCLMSGGMATIAGGVLAAYIGFLGGEDISSQIYFAKHLLAASVMSAPAAVLAAKILVPETEEVNDEMHIEKTSIGSNVLDAISNGTIQGIKLAVNVGAMLLVFLAFVAMLNYLLSNMIGGIGGLNEYITQLTGGRYTELNLQFIIGYTFAPLSWMLGVHSQDLVLVGQLLGEKTILNEFVAYISLSNMKAEGLFFENRSIIIATYLLCGFANFASIGIQIGGIGSIAPNKRKILSELGFRALIAGTLACMFTAVVVGMLV